MPNVANKLIGVMVRSGGGPYMIKFLVECSADSYRLGAADVESSVRVELNLQPLHFPFIIGVDETRSQTKQKPRSNLICHSFIGQIAVCQD